MPRDTLGDVADTLDVLNDLESRGDKPQIPGHRLVPGQERNTHFINLQLGEIDFGVPPNDILESLRVPHPQALNGPADAFFDHSGHVEQTMSQGIEFLLELSFHDFAFRPLGSFPLEDTPPPPMAGTRLAVAIAR
jgi:hypothetical protein